ncbi:MAG: hypothetical protein MNPFHGCM_00988 [Gemmatimonadaceae bacterium]|nr:hypothetical protein [Gemmatimonadaceae bacterium]
MVTELLRHRWRWPVLWALVILALTSVPASDLPNASLFPGADKVVHFGLYAVLGFLAGNAGRGRSRSLAVLVLRVTVGIGVFAALDEVHQRLIPGRSMDVRDWLADVAGAIVGVCLIGFARKRREHVT